MNAFLRVRGCGRMLNGRTIWAAKPSTSAITADEPWMGKFETCPHRISISFLFAHPIPVCRPSSPPALYTLLEINKFYPEILRSGKCEIYIDGGIRRGTDVVKALCLGAKGVGMGRPFMYALTYGEDGVAHAIESESLLIKLGVKAGRAC
jgi:hypothetical protein